MIETRKRRVDRVVSTAPLALVQLLGLLAVLSGVAVLLPLGWALVVDGALVLAAGTAAEFVVLRRVRPTATRGQGG